MSSEWSKVLSYIRSKGVIVGAKDPITGRIDQMKIQSLQKYLGREFEIKDLGELKLHQQNICS